MSAANLDVGDRGPELGKAQKPAPHDQKQTPAPGRPTTSPEPAKDSSQARRPSADGARAFDGRSTPDGKPDPDSLQARRSSAVGGRSSVADIETAGSTPRAKPATIDGLIKIIRSYNPDAD